MQIKIQKIHELATFDKAHDDDIGYDLTCVGVEVVEGVIRLNLGIKVEPPGGYYFQIVPRSSFPKTGWTQANNVGIIDPGYRGEWKMNICTIPMLAQVPSDKLIGHRVAQAILCKQYDHPKYVYHREVNETFGPGYLSVAVVNELSQTKRGEQGFGSSGI